MSFNSNDQNSKKRYLQDQDSDEGMSKPAKKVKRQKQLSNYSEDHSTSEAHKQKHKKHKKSKSKHKKHREKSEKKHKHKQKKSKHKKDKNHNKSEQDESNQDQNNPSSALSEQQSKSSLSQEVKRKMRKIKGSTIKQKRSQTPSRIKRISRKKVKDQPIVSASEDQDRPIQLENKSDLDSFSDNQREKSQTKEKKKRGRKPRSQKEVESKQGTFEIDDVINLDDQQMQQNTMTNGKGDSLAKLSKKKVDRLTKIKQPVIKNIIVTKNVQNVPVDHHFSKFNQCHVFDMGGCFYNATLTQSNIVRDDNKFFIIQILQMNHNQQQFYVYSRWGRVGVTGQISQLGPLNRQASIRHYNQVVQNKIKIGHYKVVEMNYDDYDNGKKEKGNKALQISSKLDLRIQDLTRLIFDIKMMNSHMKEIGYDEKRLPLGKLGQKAITDGYNTLNRLMAVINDKGKQAFQKKKQINQLSGLFYQCIPHDFGYMNMQTFVLDTAQKIKEKLQILSSLQQIQIYNSLMNQKISNPQLAQIDQKYFRLNINIAPIIKGSQVWKKLIKYVQNTHAKTHNKYDLEVEEIYQLKKEEMDVVYKGQIGNKMLLWHGSRLTNYVGILSKGLRIAPLEAPSTGYMFGKGIYFADMVSKAANYCIASQINNVALVLLCEVALGNMNQKYQADYNAPNLPEGKRSTKGMGQTQPMGGQYLDHLDKVWIPNGKAQPSGVVDSTLLYNEFVVYDPRQIRYRYLFRFRFHFKVAQNILPGIRV